MLLVYKQKVSQTFLKIKVKKGLSVSKKLAKNVSNNPGRALDLTAGKVTAAVSKNSKQALSTLTDLTTVYNAGEDLYLGKLVHFYII